MFHRFVFCFVLLPWKKRKNLFCFSIATNWLQLENSTIRQGRIDHKNIKSFVLYLFHYVTTALHESNTKQPSKRGGKLYCSSHNCPINSVGSRYRKFWMLNWGFENGILICCWVPTGEKIFHRRLRCFWRSWSMNFFLGKF